MKIIRYSCGHISGHHEPIHVKFGVWGFFIMFYWNIVMKMLKCKKRKFDDVTLQYSIAWVEGYAEIRWGEPMFNLLRSIKLLPNMVLKILKPEHNALLGSKVTQRSTGVYHNLFGNALWQQNLCHKIPDQSVVIFIYLRGYCTSGPYFWRLCAFSQKIKQLRTKYPLDLVRNVPRNSKITVLLQ